MSEILKKLLIPFLAFVIVAIIFFVSKTTITPTIKVSSTAKTTSSIVSSEPVISNDISSNISSEIDDKSGFDANISGIPIICYHHLLTKEQKGTIKNSIIATTDELESHLKILKQKGYSSLTCEQVLDFIKNGKQIPKKSVFLTIDDGYKSTIYLAAPIFRKYAFKAMVFVITKNLDEPYEEFDPINKKFQYFNKAEMETAKDVFEFADHTYDLHIELTKQTKDKINSDLLISKEKLNSPYFAYPIGAFNSTLINIIKEFGFFAAFTINRGHAKIDSNLFTIPRYCVLSPMSAEKLLDIVEGRAIR